MNKLKTILVLGTSLAALWLFPSSALADPPMMGSGDWHDKMMQQGGPGYGMGYGRMGMMGGGMGMMGRGMGPGGMGMMMGMLDLDDKQRVKMRDLQRAQRKANWQRRGEMIDLQYELQDLYDKDKPDSKAIGKVYDKIFNLKKQMIESHIETRNKMREVLTKEQQEKFDNLRGGMGYGMGPGMGMMGGGMGPGGMGMMNMMGGGMGNDGMGMMNMME